MRSRLAHAAAIALLGSTLLCSTTFATSQEQGFSAMQGIAAQTMSPEEMAATTGQLNAFDIAAALTSYAGTLSAYPVVQSYVLQVADFYKTNGLFINLWLGKIGLLTPCQSCTP